MAAIDPTARIEPGAVSGRRSIGPIAPLVGCCDRRGLPAHRHARRRPCHSSARDRSILRPGDAAAVRQIPRRATRPVVGAIAISASVTINTDGGRPRVTESETAAGWDGRIAWATPQGGQRCDFRQQRSARRARDWSGFRRVHGQAAVRQFVRIGEGAMVVGLSECAPTYPPGLVRALVDPIGLNVVGPVPPRLRQGRYPSTREPTRRCSAGTFAIGSTRRAR
jgi:hypothetical protein